MDKLNEAEWCAERLRQHPTKCPDCGNHWVRVHVCPPKSDKWEVAGCLIFLVVLLLVGGVAGYFIGHHVGFDAGRASNMRFF